MNVFSTPLHSEAPCAAATAGFTLVDTTLLLASLAVVATVALDRISHPGEAAPALARCAHASSAVAETVSVANSAASAGALAHLTAGQAALRDSWFGAHLDLEPVAYAAQDLSAVCPTDDPDAIVETLGIADLDSGEGLVANVSGAVQSWMDRIDAVLAVQRDLSGIPFTPAAAAR